MFLLQGASIAQLFDEKVWIQPLPFRGKLHLLRWKADALWMGGTYLEQVGFAHVLEAPDQLRGPALITRLLPWILPA